MSSHPERGQSTAEYAVGTCGAVAIALVLYRLGALGIDSPFLDRLLDAVQRALTWRNILDGFPRHPLGRR